MPVRGDMEIGSGRLFMIIGRQGVDDFDLFERPGPGSMAKAAMRAVVSVIR